MSSRAEFRAGAGGTERSRGISAVRTSAERQRTAEVPRLRCARLSACAALGMTRFFKLSHYPRNTRKNAKGKMPPSFFFASFRVFRGPSFSRRGLITQSLSPPLRHDGQIFPAKKVFTAFFRLLVRLPCPPRLCTICDHQNLSRQHTHMLGV